MRQPGSTTAMIAGCAILAALTLLPDAAIAQDIMKVPTTLLEKIRDFVLGPGGAILGGIVLAAAGLMAASPRASMGWGHFLVVLIAVSVFFGAFGIAEVIQTAFKA